MKAALHSATLALAAALTLSGVGGDEAQAESSKGLASQPQVAQASKLPPARRPPRRIVMQWGQQGERLTGKLVHLEGEDRVRIEAPYPDDPSVTCVGVVPMDVKNFGEWSMECGDRERVTGRFKDRYALSTGIDSVGRAKPSGRPVLLIIGPPIPAPVQNTGQAAAAAGAPQKPQRSANAPNAFRLGKRIAWIGHCGGLPYEAEEMPDLLTRLVRNEAPWGYGEADLDRLLAGYNESAAEAASLGESPPVCETALRPKRDVDQIRRILARASPPKGIPVAQTLDSITFEKDPRGHYFIKALVRDIPVLFMVDTGATRLVLSPADAERVGISRDYLRFSGTSRTAGGVVKVAPIQLREVSVGPITLERVDGVVNSVPMRFSLLGMAFLERLSGFSFEGERLTLNQ
ncbi:MAG: TIGR02281 family clan AA aspartic protease [Alphaproteobacteria bacterium]|nr:TIGR02281 family clan AA aspartic protease [Alphaproteobacteria bacterium]